MVCGASLEHPLAFRPRVSGRDKDLQRVRVCAVRCTVMRDSAYAPTHSQALKCHPDKLAGCSDKEKEDAEKQFKKVFCTLRLSTPRVASLLASGGGTM